MSEPSRIDFSSEGQSLIEKWPLFESSIVIGVVSLTEADRCPTPVMLLPIPIGIFIVIIAGNVQLPPHVQQGVSVLEIAIERAELVLYLDEDDIASVDVQIGSNDL